jgi:hypothetical protein
VAESECEHPVTGDEAAGKCCDKSYATDTHESRGEVTWPLDPFVRSKNEKLTPEGKKEVDGVGLLMEADKVS